MQLMGNYEKAEKILDKYSRGNLSASEVQKALKSFGYKADLRGKSNIIPVFPVDGGDGFDVELAKGGMPQQMELFEPVERGFEDGGLMDEGGMVDEESGNEVPPGSLREEVRDDIPAQLSEGEFVMPADVVRYHGLDKMMALRDEAKAGLQRMEAMGQMGNADEATIPDGVPFNVDDLETENEQEELNFQVGGFVNPMQPQQPQMPYGSPTQVNPNTGTYNISGSGISGYLIPSGGQTGYVPYGGAAPYYQPVQFTGPQFTTATQTTNIPTFAETVGDRYPGTYESYTCTNDAGQTRTIPHIDGKPLYPIPEGFVCRAPGSEQPAPPPDDTSTAPTTVVQQDDSGGGDGPGFGDVSTGVSTAKAMSSLGFTKTDESVHSNAFGGHATFGTSNEALRAATLEQAKAQLGSLSPYGAVMEAAGLTGFTSQDVAVAGNLGKQAALSSMGLHSNSQLSFSEQATMVGSVMTAAHEAAKKGQDVAAAIEAAVASPEHQAAVTTSAISHMQDLGYTSSQVNDPAAVAEAAAAYGAQVAGLQAQANEVQSKGTVRSARTGKAVTNKGQPVMTAKARAQLNAINEQIARTTAKAKAIAVQDPKAKAAMAKGNVERGDAVFGTPTQADVDRAFEAADKATRSVDADEFGNIADDGTQPGNTSQGPSFDDSSLGKGDSGSSSSSSSDSDGPGTYICTASYANGIISYADLTPLKKYGILLRRNDPYLMKAYDWFGPKLASKVKATGWTAKLSNLATSYYTARYTNTLSAKQKVYDKVTQTFVWPTLRFMGWVLTKVNK